MRLLIVSRIWSWVMRSKVFGTPGRSLPLAPERHGDQVLGPRHVHLGTRGFTEMNRPLVSS